MEPVRVDLRSTGVRLERRPPLGYFVPDILPKIQRVDESFRKFSNLIDTNPEYIVNKAVKGMLPKNKLSAKMLKRLKIYPGSEHPQQAQNDRNSKEVKSDN